MGDDTDGRNLLAGFGRLSAARAARLRDERDRARERSRERMRRLGGNE